MNALKNLKERILNLKLTRRICCAATMAAIALLTAPRALAAGGFADSKIATGTMAIFTDVAAWLTILCPVAGGLFALYFFIRRGMADETDGKQWTKRITTAIICGVAGGLVSGFIALISSYYA